jgi:hypothetical protein
MFGQVPEIWTRRQDLACPEEFAENLTSNQYGYFAAAVVLVYLAARYSEYS